MTLLWAPSPWLPPLFPCLGTICFLVQQWDHPKWGAFLVAKVWGQEKVFNSRGLSLSSIPELIHLSWCVNFFIGLCMFFGKQMWNGSCIPASLPFPVTNTPLLPP